MGERPRKPIYRTLADEFRGYILKGQWAVGRTIPSEAELCARFSASRSTIRKTLEHLKQEGYLERRPGKGTWVNDYNNHEELWTVDAMTPLLPFPELIRVDIITRETLAGDLSDPILSAFQDSELITRIKALRWLEKTPLQLVHVHVRPDDADIIIDAFDPEKDIFFYRVLERMTGKAIYTVQDTYEAVLAVGETAELLQLSPGSPLIMVTRKALETGGNLLLMTRLFMRTDIQKIKMTRKKHLPGSPAAMSGFIKRDFPAEPDEDSL